MHALRGTRALRPVCPSPARHVVYSARDACGAQRTHALRLASPTQTMCTRRTDATPPHLCAPAAHRAGQVNGTGRCCSSRRCPVWTPTARRRHGRQTGPSQPTRECADGVRSVGGGRRALNDVPPPSRACMHVMHFPIRPWRCCWTPCHHVCDTRMRASLGARVLVGALPSASCNLAGGRACASLAPCRSASCCCLLAWHAKPLSACSGCARVAVCREVWVLPSTSGRAAMGKADRTGPWVALGERVRAEPWPPSTTGTAV
jgi:hypothetical protein